MKGKLIKKLTHNIGLKIASVLLAVVLWLVVISINNPTTSESFYNIPVTLLNTDMITDSGRVFEVLDGTDNISRVTVRAPRSIASELKAENIIATADVNELSSLDTISIKLSTNIANQRDITLIPSHDIIRLKIENKRSKALALKASVTGSVEDGYMIGDISTDQNLVRISGPESVIDQVVRATANVDMDITGVTSDIVTNAEIRLYDKEDRLIENSNISMNIKTVGVKVSIWQTASVPVNFSFTGTPGAGSRVTGEIEGNGSTIKIAGKSNVIRNVSSIEVPAEELDITDMTESLVKDIDIRRYLPDNVFLADNADAVKTVTVNIEREVSKRLQIREENVRVTNIPEGYEASISGLEESFIVEAIGLAEEVSELRGGDLNGTVDISAWMQQHGMDSPDPGFYTVEVAFNLPEGVTLLEPVTVTLHISEIGDEE